MPSDARFMRLFDVVNLERGIALAVAAIVVGLALLLEAVNIWRLHDFGRLDYAVTMRWVIPGATLTALGVQTLFSSFFVSILGLRKT